MDEGRLDELLGELGEVQDALLALPSDAFAERHRLRTRQDELRRAVARFREDLDAGRPDADLLAELAALRARLAAIEKDKIDLVVQSGSTAAAGPGADGWGGVALNQKIGDAQGIGALQARIGRIKGILRDRGVEFPPG